MDQERKVHAPSTTIFDRLDIVKLLLSGRSVPRHVSLMSNCIIYDRLSIKETCGAYEDWQLNRSKLFP